ncbi:RICIN domain-containing protein [Kribbella albertanoniae]|nr:RICIN domain-containing protein [Kribbella albertanoniae]
MTVKKINGILAGIIGGATLVSALGAVPAQAATSAGGEDLPTNILSFSSSTGIKLLTAEKDLNGDFAAGVTIRDDATPGRDDLATTPLNQKWTAFRVGKGHVICTLSIGGDLAFACLDIVNNSTASGANVGIRPFDGSPSQQWQVIAADPKRPRAKFLRNVNSGKVMQVVGIGIRQQPLDVDNNSFTQSWFPNALR